MLALAAAFIAETPAQLAAQQAAIQLQDTSALKPPAGARVAIVEFDDLQCPACAHANPVLKEAAAKYKIPWIRHDFLIPAHTWSRNAAIRARWFDTKGKGLGDEYRDEVFANQQSIYNLAMLSQFTERFAQNHGVPLPFAVDPDGKLEAEVMADTNLAHKMGLTVTPTVFVVMANSKGTPYIWVKNPEQDLYQDIDEALKETQGK
jgi:protein-disulfide isomerase